MVFIALTFGRKPAPAGTGGGRGARAVLLVTAVGVIVRPPLAQVPENAMKFGVGVMLTSFGIFWGAEGAGAEWPGGDAALLLVVPAVLAFSLVLVRLFRVGPRGAVGGVTRIRDDRPGRLGVRGRR